MITCPDPSYILFKPYSSFIRKTKMHKIHISKLLFEYISLLPAQQTWIPFLVSVGHLHRGAANPRAAPANAALCARARACAARTVPALLKLLTRWWCNAKTPLMIDMNFLTASLFLNPHTVCVSADLPATLFTQRTNSSDARWVLPMAPEPGWVPARGSAPIGSQRRHARKR